MKRAAPLRPAGRRRVRFAEGRRSRSPRSQPADMRWLYVLTILQLFDKFLDELPIRDESVFHEMVLAMNQIG